MKLRHAKLSPEDRAAKLASVLKDPSPAPGRYSDGRNLYLNVSKTGAKSWVFLWLPKGAKNQRELGLGSFTGAAATVSLTLDQARRAADKVRDQIAAGIDPVATKVRAKVAKPRDDSPGIDARLAELRSRKPELAELLERQIDALLKTADGPLGDVANSAQPKSDLPKKRRVGRPAKPLPSHLQVIVDRKA